MEPKEEDKQTEELDEYEIKMDKAEEIMDMILKFRDFREGKKLTTEEKKLLFYDILKGLFEAGELLRPDDKGFKTDPLFGGSNAVEFALPHQGIVSIWAEHEDNNDRKSKFEISIHVYRPIK